MKILFRTETLLCCIIFIFHCGPFSGRAQNGVLLKAVEYEKTAYEAEDTYSAGEALMLKARCYAYCGEYGRAVSTLERVAMYAFSSQERNGLLMEKALYSALSGDFDAYSALTDEIASDCEIKADEELLSLFSRARTYIADNTPELKSESKAFALTFLPPLAHIYVGKPEEGVLRAAGDIAALSLGVFEALTGNWISAFLSCSVGLYESYWKGNADILEEVGAINEQSLKDFTVSLDGYLRLDLQSWLEKNLLE